MGTAQLCQQTGRVDSSIRSQQHSSNESEAGEVMTLATTTEASVVANAVVATTLEMAATMVAIAVRES